MLPKFRYDLEPSASNEVGNIYIYIYPNKWLFINN